MSESVSPAEMKSLSANILTDNFETIAKAKDGIPKLREMILQLAVQGKLVPQNPEDEPASVLLKMIQAEKARLVKEGKLKRQKNLDPINLDPTIRTLPRGWNTCLLGEVIELINGRAYKRSELLDEGTPIIRIQNLNDGNSWYYSDLNLPDKNYCERGDLLFAWSASFGPYIWNGPRAIFHYHIWKLVLQDAIDKRFVFYLLRHLTERIKSKSHGLAMLHMTKGNMEHVVIHLPPLAEQHRIVERVDALMNLCDELEARQDTESERRQMLLISSLSCLFDAKEPEEAAVAREILHANFDLLFDDTKSIAELRKTILQLAVQGRLVEQHPEDEPASVLLKRIQGEKARLVKEGKIKKSKALPPVDVDEVTYALPEGWVWTRLQNIGIINPRNLDIPDDLETSFVPMPYVSEKYGLSPISDVKNWSEIKCGYTHFGENDVVLAKITPCFQNGKSGHITTLKNGIGAGTTELHVFRGFYGLLSPKYVLLYLKTPKFILEGIPKMTGSAGQKRIPKSYFAENPFPLPPLAEQHRIVERVDALMALCEELDGRVLAKEDAAERLLLSVCDGICG